MTIVEIKAGTERIDEIRKILVQQKGLRSLGTDRQTDTYYVVPHGRLKIRQGPIENTLIFYRRADHAGPKTSRVYLYKSENLHELKPLLDAAFRELVTVRKQREIYFINNVKFHLDYVEGLGQFVEIEAMDELGDATEQQLRDQCVHYIQLLGIDPDTLITNSYSDLLLEQ